MAADPQHFPSWLDSCNYQRRQSASRRTPADQPSVTNLMTEYSQVAGDVLDWLGWP